MEFKALKKIFIKSNPVESFWAEPVGFPYFTQRYLVKNILFFSKDLAYGDIVSVYFDKMSKRFFFKTLVKNGGHSNIRCKCNDQDYVSELRGAILLLGGDLEAIKVNETILISIDIPTRSDYSEILNLVKDDSRLYDVEEAIKR